MKPKRKTRPVVAGIVHRNIRTMLHAKRRAAEQKGFAYRLANAITRLVGSFSFVCGQLALVSAWVAVNLGWIRGVKPFDPYPFTLLCTLITLEAILVSLFILMNQNHMADLAQKRED